MNPLHSLADACGLARHWRDVEGQDQTVSDSAIEAILAALGHEVDSERQIVRSLSSLARAEESLPAMLVTDVDVPIELPFTASSAEIADEAGVTQAIGVSGGHIGPIARPGYYDLVVDGKATRLAVAPRHCPLPPRSPRKPWGVSLQIPALVGSVPSAFGGFGELAQAIPHLARGGCDAVAINPVHALFPGNGEGFSPYSPSSRRFLNAAMADPALAGLPKLPPVEGEALIDWTRAMPQRLVQLRAVFDNLSPAMRGRIERETADEADLRRHAIFDALYCHFRHSGAHGWRDWPQPYRNPDSPEVARFASDHAEDVSFHLFAQWLARQGLEAIHREVERSGMTIGLVSDLAVGVDPSGSDAWSMREAMLRGLTIGAPPDPLGPLGQNWSITGFAPEGLARTGYGPWIAMLRSTLAACGAIRIDHAFGLARLWVIPEGATSADGVYLTYPFEDLVRLATLEAYRANALVIAEDLGTAPFGFVEAVRERQMLGMQVLWFERAEDHGFIGAQDYAPTSVAMTGTHDTVTVAGWWRGKDLDWADRLGRLPPELDRDEAEAIRDWDRGLLWSTIGKGQPRPAPHEPEPVVDAAIAHIARTPSALAIVPLEDLLGIDEQPNLPGTVTEHPNWRRRNARPLKDVLAEPQVAARCASLSELRKN